MGIEINLEPEEWFEITEIVAKESDGLALSDFDNLVRRGQKLASIVSKIRTQISNQIEDKSLGYSLSKIKKFMK